MPKTVTDTGFVRPLLDIASYARRGPGQRDRLSSEEIALITRTVRRTPEVMVKVLSRGGQDMRAVGRHFSYLSRKGDLAIETDDGQEIRGKDAEAALIKDWDLDIQEQRPTSSLGPGLRRTAPKMVHKVLFSMPPGTPPYKVLQAVKAFAREEFGLRHRYAMVLHTDEPHPHIHMIVKAVSEEGTRLNIRKSTLRNWRREFARQLRLQGVSANATDRGVRGKTRSAKPDGIYWAERHGDYRHEFARDQMGAVELQERALGIAKAETSLLNTRRVVARGWETLSEILHGQNQWELAAQVRQFSAQMLAPSTDQELVAECPRQQPQAGPYARQTFTR